MAKKITLENLAEKIDEGFKKAEKHTDKKIDRLASAVKQGFDENTKQHQKIFDRLVVIEKKLEGIVYRKEFEELEKRIKIIEETLAIRK